MKRWGILAAALLTMALLSPALAAEHNDGHSLCVKAGCTAEEHGHEAVAWTAWDGEDSLPTEAGSYYLTKDVVLSETWEVPAGGVDLCLNGHVVRAAEGETITLVNISEGASLQLTDCNSKHTVHTFTVDSDGLWVLTEDVDGEDVKTVSGGVLTGGEGITGGGFDNVTGGGITNRGSLSFYGGSIAGCKFTPGSGGGGGIFSDGTLVMYGGAIKGCVVVKRDLKGQPIGASFGGGIYCGRGTFHLYDGLIEECRNWTRSGEGGGICISGAKFWMYGGTVCSCSAPKGGGISHGWGTSYLIGGSIENCTAESSGGGVSGLALGSSGTLQITGTQILSCTAKNGGGVAFGEGSLTFSSIIEDCSAEQGGGVWIEGGKALSVTGGSIMDCKATASDGGGIYLTAGTLDVSDLALSGCTAKGSGGGIYCGGESRLTVTGGSVTDCYAQTGQGGGIYLMSGTVDISGLALSACEAGGSGGCVYCGEGRLTASDSSFTDCTALAGAGLCLKYGSMTISGRTFIDCIAGDGGGIYCGGTLTSTGSSASSFTDCQATTGDGGGVFAAGNSELLIDTLLRCEAEGSGGGIYCEGGLTLTGGSITYCKALTGCGGGLCAGEEMTVSGFTVSDCTAGESGGGLCTGGALTLLNTSVTGCSATASGGGVHLLNEEGTGVTVAGLVTVTGNTAGGAVSNLTLPWGVLFSFSDEQELDTASRIGFTDNATASVLTITAKSAPDGSDACFVPDNPYYLAVFDKNYPGQVCRVMPSFTQQPDDTDYTVALDDRFTYFSGQWYTAGWEDIALDLEVEHGEWDEVDDVYRPGVKDLTIHLFGLTVGQVFTFDLSAAADEVRLTFVGFDYQREGSRYTCTTNEVSAMSGVMITVETSGVDFTLSNLSLGQRAIPGTAVAGQTGLTLNTEGLAAGQYVYAAETAEGAWVISAPVCIHTWEQGETTPSTCTEEGGTAYTCTVCGKIRTEPVAPLGHEYGEWIVDPTWGETGITHRFCVRDGHEEVDAENALPALTDTSVWTAGDRQEPTATENGYQKYTSVEYGPATEILPALGVYTVAWADGEARITGTRVRSCLAVFAAYKNGQLTAVELVPFTLVKEAADGETVVTVTPETFAPGGNDVRIFLLDGGETPWPLCARWPAP